jgi:Xaa-Pro aminopeptidase
MTPAKPFDPEVGYALGGKAAFPLPEGVTPTRDLLQYVPRLSLQERDRRWREMRKRMLFAGIDALVFLGNDIFWDCGMANIRYMFEVGSKMGAIVLFPMEGEPAIWHGIAHMSRPMDANLARQEWVSDFRPMMGLASVVAEIESRGLARGRIGLVGFANTVYKSTLLYNDVVGLQKGLPNAEVIDISWMLQEMRLIKSEEEIGVLRKAGNIARKVIDTMLDFSKSGVTEAELWAEMFKTQIVNGGEPDAFIMLSSGPVEHGLEAWNLLHGMPQPMVPTMRPLREGDLVIAEYHTKYGGYLCHTEYTVYVGKKVPRELAEIWKVCVECLQISADVMVPGVTLREAWEKIRMPCQRAGYDFVELGWHGMGNASPEYPTVIYRPGWGNAALNGHQIGDMVFEEGMTFGNNIDIHNPQWKFDVGCKLSDFMVVRPGRAELLVDVPTELHGE